jgi:hypothetical protein
MRVINSNIVTAFDDQTIGAKVVGKAAFNTLLNEAVAAHDFSTGPVPGQAVIDLLTPRSKFFQEHPHVARECVLSGNGRKTRNPDDYVCRLYRGEVHMFLKRHRASRLHSLRAVVDTVEAYLRDPDVLNDWEEIEKITLASKSLFEPVTHVLVAILAGEAEGFVSPYRFVANLAGGNLEYAEGTKSYADLVYLAQQVKNYDDEWATVAD